MEQKNLNSHVETAKTAVRRMKISWNLGNAMDSCGLGHVSVTRVDSSAYETQWGNPVICGELVKQCCEMRVRGRNRKNERR